MRAGAAWVCAVGVLVLVASPTRAAEPTGPTIAFDGKSLSATGITPGGRAVWFGVGRDFSGDALDIRTLHEHVVDGGKDGELQLALDYEVPAQSIWLVADVETGAYAIGAPGEYQPSEVTFPARAVAATRRHLELERYSVEAILLRPGVGAYFGRFDDGSMEGDDDQLSDGRVRALLSALEPLGASPPAPEKLSPKDVLLLLDGDRMEVSAVTFVQGGN